MGASNFSNSVNRGSRKDRRWMRRSSSRAFSHVCIAVCTSRMSMETESAAPAYSKSFHAHPCGFRLW
eukprot:4166802-Prymnesium_polylepis.2